MPARTNLHYELVLRACRWLRRRRCVPVLAEFSNVTWEHPDAIGWSSFGWSHVVEVKVSRADLRADAKKPHVASGHAMGAYRWYLVPSGLVTAEEPPPDHGLLFAGPKRITIIREAPQRECRNWTAEVQALQSVARRHELGVPWLADSFRFEPYRIHQARELARKA